MKTIILTIITAVTINLSIKNTFAQNSPYELYIDNIVKSAQNKIEFDLMIKSTDADNKLKYKGGQYFIKINERIKNGGNLSFSTIAGSSELEAPLRPRNPKILKGNILALAVNNFAGNNVMEIPKHNPVKIFRLELSTSADAFDNNEQILFDWNTGDKWKTKVFHKAPGNELKEVTDSDNHKIKNVKIIEKNVKQGLRNGNPNAENRTDTMTVILRSAVSPYNVVESRKAVKDIHAFTCQAVFETLPAGTYYIVLKDFQCIETWSKAGGELIIPDTSAYFYNFTDSVSKAFGSNLHFDQGLWAIYNGDVNQDGIIDATDLNIVDNDALNFVAGYVSSDIDGNFLVDAMDMAIVDNNAASFVSSVTP